MAAARRSVRQAVAVLGAGAALRSSAAQADDRPATTADMTGASSDPAAMSTTCSPHPDVERSSSAAWVGQSQGGGLIRPRLT